jgi:hypothetical protein
MSWNYVSKVGKIYVKTLTLADTWYQILTAEQCKAIRGVKVKTRYVKGQAINPFDYAFNATPEAGDDTTAGLGYWSNTGMGVSDMISPSNGLWARSQTAGCQIEVQIYE